MTRYFLYENSTSPQPPPTPCSDGDYSTLYSTLSQPPPTPPSNGGLSTALTMGISVGTVLGFLFLLVAVIKLMFNGTLSITSPSGEFDKKIQEAN
nr:hypothetical protein CFP56_55555 [Quercus suber]